jgi:hypothetical protein
MGLMAYKLGEYGYMVLIMKIPFNLAFFDSNKTDEVIPQHPRLKHG